MSLKQQLSKYTNLSNMSSAPFFTLTGNGEELVVQADSVTGLKVKQYIEGQCDKVLAELKEEVSQL